MSDTGKAVFLSYASQDAAAVARIAEALRTAGVEVWFDRNELVGGDAWDAKIRKQIAECALFVPVISAATQARTEGYFRLEWKIAAQRTHMIADDAPFLLPVVIDETRDADARVPAEFKNVQWTRLPGGETPEAFRRRVAQLLAGEAGRQETGPVPTADRGGGGLRPSGSGRRAGFRPWRWAVLALAVGAGLAVWRPWQERADPAAARELSPARELAAQARRLMEQEDDSNRENFAIAEDLLLQAEKLAPFDGEIWAAHAQLSGALRSLGYDSSDQRRADLRRQAERAVKLAPESPESRLAWVCFLASQRTTLAEAAQAAQDLIRRRPDDWRPLALMGEIAERQGNRDEAIDWFKRMAAFPAAAAVAKVEMATLLFLAGQFDEADQAVDEALALRPLGRALLLKIRSQVLWRGDLDGAKATVEKVPPAVLLEDRGAFNAFRVWLWRREPERALALLRGIPRDFLSDGQFTGPKAVLVAAAQQLAGRPDLARPEWELALRVLDERLRPDPGNTRLLYLRALCLIELERLPEAEIAFRAFRQTGREGMQMWPGGGTAGLLLKLGRPAEAMDLIAQEQERGVRLFNSRAVLGLNPAFDPLRGEARFRQILDRAPGPAAGAAAQPAEKASQKSVAVLAFANLSDDKANEYFSDGITEELLNVLAKVPGLKVTARTSSFFFKDKQAPIPEIAEKLGVAYVVEGSVRRQGEKVRITAQLIKAADGFHVWSDTFTRDLKDIFAVQDEIAGLIAKSLSLKLGASSAAAKAAVPPQAFELYVQARQAWNLRTEEANDRAERLLMRVLELAPEFARAHAALADVWLMRLGFGGLPAAGEALAATEEARIRSRIDRALALDPESAEAHASLGLWHLSFRRVVEAEPALRRAVALNPNYASAQQWLARALIGSGHMDEALQRSKLAVELDPLVGILWDQYGRWLVFAGRDEAAIAAFDRAIAVQPDYVYVLGRKADVLAQSGRAREAVALVGNLPSAYEAAASIRFNVYALAGLKAEAEAVLATIPPSDPYGAYRATGLIALGRSEDALAAVTSSRMTWSLRNAIIWSRTYDPLRHDPRWVKFLADAGLTEAHERAQAWLQAHPPEKPAAKP